MTVLSLEVLSPPTGPKKRPQGAARRLLEFIVLLQRRPWSVNQLCAHLKVSKRSVYRYLNTLKICGLEVQHDPSGRFYSLGGGEASVAVTARDLQALRTVLSSQVSAPVRSQLQDLAARIEFCLRARQA